LPPIDSTKPLIFAALELEAAALRKELNIEVQVIGIRACRLPRALPRASRIILAGLAGALDPALKIGDIVMDGSIHTSDRLIATAAEKAELFQTTGARAVDMETAVVRRAAQAAGIPFTAIRAVSDTADQALDPALLTVVDEVGRPRPLKVAALLVRRPNLVPQLRRLEADSRKALAALAIAVGRLCQ